MNSYSANTDMLLLAAWLSTQPEAVVAAQQRRRELEEASRKRTDVEAVVQRLVGEELDRLKQNGLYGDVYAQVLRHRLIVRVDLSIITWALERGAGLTYEQDHMPNLLPSQREEAERSPTSVVWDAIVCNPRVFARLQQQSKEWKGDAVWGGKSLQALFSLSAPLVMRTHQRAFFVPELLQASLKEVEWDVIATHILNLASAPLSSDSNRFPNADAEAQIALLQAQIWQSCLSFKDAAQHPVFSEQLHKLCRDLAIHCYQAHEAIGHLDTKTMVLASE